MRALIVCMIAASGIFAAYDLDVKTAEELRVRDGLPNFFVKLARGGDVRIAYLGGSITMADGWRVKTLAHFRTEYPKANIIEINAAISGTGSDYGACRLPDHVLRHNPDLLFVEFRVNGGDLKSMEGIVRQTWAKNPETDICFVYTISEYMVPSLSSGKNVTFGSIQETVANRYGIPTIDFGLEVTRQVKDGSLIFKADKAPEGKKIFAKDGTHPGDEGHTIYRDVIVRSFASMKTAGTSGAHAMPEQLDARSWTQAKQAPVTAALLSTDWSPVDIATDAIIARGGVRSVKMFPAAVKTSAQGASITIRFNGTTAGFIDIPGPKETTLTAVIDGKAPITLSRKDAYRTEQTMGRFFFIPEQAPGEHTVRFEVSEIPDGMNYYVGPLLIVGEILPAAK
ncbi:MAG: SGNH/GDSL hydrolase family protein [Spirochaetes bacterium]|nr:SGNH/GDSL hydrolase family protein [Spirochaetota bacterium]